MPTIHVRASRADVVRLVRTLPALLAGRQGDPTGLARRLQLLVGTVALSLIKDNFVQLARGQAGADGTRWPPLKPETIAYSRRHPGLVRKKKGERPRGLLSDAEDARWRGVFAGVYAHTGNPGKAGATAWATVKREGARTILGEYGDVAVEINRDTGRLLNSFGPGVADNVLEARAGAVVVGTNVEYAAAVHALRRLWPEPSAWPDAWWAQLAGTLRQGAVTLIARLLGGTM